MDSKEYLLNIIKEELEETASGSNNFSEFVNATREAQKPFDTQGMSFNPNPRMGFIYHGTDRSAIDSICNTGASGSKEFYGKAIGQVYGRGLYAMINPDQVSVGNCTVEFAVKPGAFDNFIIFQHSYRELLFKKGLITRRNESLGDNIRRLLDKDSIDMFKNSRVDLDRISLSTFRSYMQQGESNGGWGRGYGSETRLDNTNIDGWTIDYGGPAVVVRRADIVVPNRWRMRGEHEWHYCIKSEEQFDKLNLYFDAYARVRGEYPNTSFNQKPSAGFMLIGDGKKGNLVNLRTGEYFSPVPLKNCTGFSMVKEYGFNTATFTLGRTEYILRTPDEGKTIQILYRKKGSDEIFQLKGGYPEFRALAESGQEPAGIGVDEASVAPVKNPNGYNFEMNDKMVLPIDVPYVSEFKENVASFKFGGGDWSLVLNNGNFNIVRNGQTIPSDKFLMLIKVMIQKGVLPKESTIYNDCLLFNKGSLNESFMSGSFDDFRNNEIPNTTTLYSRSTNFGQFANDVKGGKNIYFYTCSKPENAKSMMQNGMTYEFTGTSNDSTTFQGVVAYGAFSLAAAERNMNLGYGNAIYKFVLKDDLSKYIIFDPRIRDAFGFGGEKVSEQIRRMCAGKMYKGRPLFDVLDYGLKHPIKGYGQNPHLRNEGVKGLDHLSTSTQGDACAAFFVALRGELKGRLNGATLYDEIPVHLMGIHGYIYNGGNHWDCICVRNYNALMPVAYAVSRGYGSNGLPRDEKGHIIWKTNEYMTQEWFDRMNDNVTARFQYAGEYADTPMNTKQSCGFTLVNGSQGYNFMDVRYHRHLLPIDVEHASRFTKASGVPMANFTFAKSNWELYVRDGRVDLVRNGQVIPGDKFVQLIKIMIQKGVLPKDTKIHTDAIIGGNNMLEEANHINWEKRVSNTQPSKDDAMNFSDGDMDFDSLEGDNSNEKFEKKDQMNRVYSMMKEVLNTREFAIMAMLFGIKDKAYNPSGKVFSLEEVAKKFGLTRERTRIVREVSLRKLRDNENFVNSARQMLAEGENRTKNKGLRGGIDNLKAQEGRLQMNSETFFTNPNAIEIFNKIAVLLMGDKKSITNGKNALLTLFEDDDKASRIFKDEEARVFAAFCVYGQKSPLRFDPSTNKYYGIVSKMVSPGSAKSTEKAAIDAKVAAKDKRVKTAMGSIDARKEEGMDYVERLCKNYRNFYLKGNTIYMAVLDSNKHFTKQGREDWISLRKKLSSAGYTTTNPRWTQIRVKGETTICAYVNVDKPEEQNTPQN